MTDLKHQLRAYYEATTTPADIEAIALDHDTVTLGPVPDAAQRRSAMKTLPTQQSRPSRWMGPRMAWIVFLVTAAVVAAVTISLVGGSGDSDAAGSDPASVLEAYATAYNAKDMDALLALYTEESEVSFGNRGGPVIGLESLRLAYEKEFANSAEVDALVYSNIQVSGNTVNWDQIWTDATGRSFCSPNPWSAVIENGKILSRTFRFGSPC